MITDDEIMRLFELADPAREDDGPRMVDAAGYLEALQQRSYDMKLIDTATEAPTQSPRNNKWLLATVVAAAIMLIVAGALLLTRDDGDPVPVAPPTTVAPVAPTTAVEQAGGVSVDEAIALVRSYYDAHNAYDADLAMSFLSDEAIASKDWGSPEQFRLEVEYSATTKAQQLLGDCTPIESQGPGLTIRCDFDEHNFRSQDLGLGPFGDNSTDIVVLNGKITSIMETSAWETNGQREQIWDPYSEWVAAQHPSDGEIMYGDRAMSEGQTEESIRLWDQRLSEWVDVRLAAEQVATEFLQAFGAFDAEAAGAYLTAGASTERIIAEDVQDYRQAIALYQAWGYEQTLGACQQGSATATGLIVRCPLTYQLLGSRELGFGPYDGSYFTVTVDDESGMITKVVMSWIGADLSREVTDPFTEWLTTNYPNDESVMAVEGGPALTPESLALWEQHRRDYVQYVLGSTPPTTAG